MRVFKLMGICILFLFGAAVVTSCGADQASGASAEPTTGKASTAAYICPMHCAGSGSEEPGTCPFCRMDYLRNEDQRDAAEPVVQ
jgi:hypothetical protein